jgi:DNA helicase-2/ATP-dependent DNA helicase PcrA
MKTYGPPGTGKTTRLLQILQEQLRSGVRPERIAFVSFTKKAAEEGAQRAHEVLNIKKAQLPHFRTLHSTCFRLLQLGRNEVIQHKHYKDLAQKTGVEYSGRMSMEDGVIQGDKLGDRYLFLDQLSRNKLISLHQAWQEAGDDLLWADMEWFIKALHEYKQLNGLLDFTDMLQRAQQEEPLDIDVAIIDEAQDMTPLQWRVAFHLFSHAEKMYIAGDDDQAIYKWSGADVEEFNGIPGEVEVLEKSYRLPSKIFNLANSISGNISQRMPKEWHPEREGGVVEYHTRLDSVDLGEGQWLLLARNKYLLTQLTQYCVEQGHAFTTKMGPSVDKGHLGAIVAWESLRKGKQVRVDRLHQVTTLMGYSRNPFKGLPSENLMTLQEVQALGIREGVGDSWYKVLIKIPLATREYYSSIIQNGERLQDEARIHVDTIHGVKGGEADNVLIMTDQSYRTWKASHSDPDSEHRVMYVGVTRARKALHILLPQTDKGYNEI